MYWIYNMNYIFVYLELNINKLLCFVVLLISLFYYQQYYHSLIYINIKNIICR